MPSLTASYSGFVNGDTAASLTTPPTLATTATAASHVSGSPYTITASGAADPDYSISYVAGTLTVTAAPLTITAVNQTKVYGAALPSLTASYSGFVNGDTSASLTTQPTLATTATASSHVSGSPYAITASGAADTDYSISYVAGTLTVAAAPLTITAVNKTKVYGAALPSLTASYSGFVNGDTSASLTTQPTLATTATASSHVSGSPYTITASGAADTDYTISYVAGTLTVTTAPLTITAVNQTKVYGAALPSLTASYSGFVNGDTAASLTTQPTLATTATAASHVSGSPYTITASAAADTDYSISYVAGTLTVTAVPLTITAVNQTKVYGATLPTLTASYSGFVNGDTSSSLTTPPTLTTTATAASHVSGSPYTITASGAADTDYSISYMAGTLTVTTAPLTITAVNQTKVYGAALPSLTASYSGFVNGDTAASLTTQPTLATTATASSHVSGNPYAITASGAADTDYSISYVAGTLTVTAVPLTITAVNQTKVYGAALPSLTASYSGFVNGDTAASLTTPPTLTSTATAASHVSGSPYTITASGAVDTDYAISYVAGTLTVTAVPLTITAVNQTKVYGAALPSLTASYSGFVNGDTAASLTTQPTLTTTATVGSSVSGSPYSITVSGAADADYTISYVAGSLTVTQEIVTVGSVQTMSSLEASSNVGFAIGSGGDLTVNQPITLDSGGGVSVSQSGRVTVSGINSQPGATGIDLNSGSLRAGADFTTAVPVAIDSGGGTIDANGHNLVFAGTLNGPGRLTKTGAGIVTLSGTSGYTGGTKVLAGTLLVTDPSALPGETSLTIGAGGTFIFDPMSSAASTVSNDTSAAMSSAAIAPTAVPISTNLASSRLVLSAPGGDDASVSSSVVPPRGTRYSGSGPVSVPAGVLGTPAGVRVVWPSIAEKPLQACATARNKPLEAVLEPSVTRIVGDPAWLGKSANSSNDSGPRHKKDVAILALEAVFAQYGR